jgi:hypothetical protein
MCTDDVKKSSMVAPRHRPALIQTRGPRSAPLRSTQGRVQDLPQDERSRGGQGAVRARERGVRGQARRGAVDCADENSRVAYFIPLGVGVGFGFEHHAKTTR